MEKQFLNKKCLVLTGSLRLGPLISLLDAMAKDVELARLANPFPLRLLGRLPVFPPPILDPVGDHFLGVRHHNVLEMGCCAAGQLLYMATRGASQLTNLLSAHRPDQQETKRKVEDRQRQVDSDRGPAIFPRQLF